MDIGDKVLRFKQRNHKQESCWQGPYVVAWKNRESTLFRLATEDGQQLPYVEGRFNLRKYYEEDQEDQGAYDSYDANGILPPDDNEIIQPGEDDDDEELRAQVDAMIAENEEDDGDAN